MSLKRRLGEGDETPSIAAAAVTVTLSSEGSLPEATRSGYSAEAQPHSVDQQAEAEAQDSCHPFLQRFRSALQGAQPLPRSARCPPRAVQRLTHLRARFCRLLLADARSSMTAALDVADANMAAVVIPDAHDVVQHADNMLFETQAAHTAALQLLEVKKAEAKRALQLLMSGEEEA